MEAKSEFQIRNAREWKETISELFPLIIPERAIWTNALDIVNILNHLCKRKNLNHVMYPKYGGMDMSGAKISEIEEDCIELDMQGIPMIVRPNKLNFESFNSAPEWFYFRMDTNQLKPTGIYDSVDYYEDLLDINGEYFDSSHYDAGNLDGKPLPKEARRLSRYLKGSFVIFQKTSIYNRTSSTYDGRHDKIDSDEFREYIQLWINGLKQ